MRAQTSPEYMVVLTLLLFIFLIFYTVYVGEASNLESSREKLMAAQEAYSLSAAIDYVYLAGDGASLNYTLPFHDYSGTLTASGRVVESARGGSASQSPILSPIEPAVEVTAAQIVIRNSGGVVLIEQ